jgi:predicted RNase H-like HicB family nuclease
MLMYITLTVLVHEDETGGYWGEVLELPGCASQGEDLDEMDRNIREAIEGVLEVKAEDGEDLSAIRKAGDVQVSPSVRKWEIAVQAPMPAPA